jgi:hypothetical protein
MRRDETTGALSIEPRLLASLALRPSLGVACRSCRAFCVAGTAAFSARYLR